PLPVPKSQSSPVSRVPLPHTALGATHAPFLHTRLVPQLCPFFVRSALVWQVCVALHAAILQSAGAGQSATGSAHERWQLFSQPAPATWLPSSHSSGAATTPSPHTASLQIPLRQILLAPHDAWSASGVPFTHSCVSPHVSVPLHGS